MRNGHGDVEKYLAQKYSRDLANAGIEKAFLPPDKVGDLLNLMSHYNRAIVSVQQAVQHRQPAAATA